MNILKTIKIIAPGIRYDLSKPLLKMFDESIKGDTLYLNYSYLYDIDKDFFDKEEAFKYSINKIKEVDLSKYNEIIFIGKSIGTYVSGRLIQELNLPRAKFICLTPLDISLGYLRQTDYIVYGTKDKYLSKEGRDFLKYMFVNLSIIDDANHRLEVGDEAKNKKILDQVKIEGLTYLECSNYME